MSEELKPCPFCGAPDIGGGMFMHSVTCALKYIEARESVPDWAWNERHIPEGYALVPVEPTRVMRDAFHDSYEDYENGDASCPDAQWKAMIAAAQEQSND